MRSRGADALDHCEDADPRMLDGVDNIAFERWWVRAGGLQAEARHEVRARRRQARAMCSGWLPDPEDSEERRVAVAAAEARLAAQEARAERRRARKREAEDRLAEARRADAEAARRREWELDTERKRLEEERRAWWAAQKAAARKAGQAEWESVCMHLAAVAAVRLQHYLEHHPP